MSRVAIATPLVCSARYSHHDVSCCRILRHGGLGPASWLEAAADGDAGGGRRGDRAHGHGGLGGLLRVADVVQRAAEDERRAAADEQADLEVLVALAGLLDLEDVVRPRVAHL